MLILQMRQANVPKKTLEQLDSILDGLPSSHRRLLSPSLQLQAVSLGTTELRSPVGRPPPDHDLYPSDSPFVRTGEIISDSDGRLVAVALREQFSNWEVREGDDGYLSRVPTKSAYSVRLCSVGRDLESPLLHEVQQHLEQALNVRFKPTQFRSDSFDRLRDEGRQAPTQPADDEVGASESLADRDVRTLATSVKTAGGLLVSDLQKQLPPASKSRVDEIKDTLQDRGLISSEVVVVCRKTSAQTVRAPLQGCVGSNGVSRVEMFVRQGHQR